MSGNYRRTRQFVSTGFAFALLSLVFVGTVTIKGVNDFVRTADALARHQRILDRIGSIRYTMSKAESEQRGFLLSGKTTYLDIFDRSPQLLKLDFEILHGLAAGGPYETRIRAAETAANQKYQEMRRTIGLFRSGKERESIELVRSGYGLTLMNEFDAEFSAIERTERLAFTQSAEANLRNRDSVTVAIFAGLTVAIASVLLSMIVVTRDARRRMDAEQSLQKALALQELIFNSVDAAIIATDNAGRVTHFNQVAARWLGYAPDEMIGKAGVLDRLHKPGDIEATARTLSEELGEAVPPDKLFGWLPERGRIFEREWTLVRKDGTDFPVMLSISALRGINGEVVGLVGIVSDLTKEKEARRQLDQYLSDLAQKNRQLEATAVELQKSRDLALAATRMKSEFLANMSHEIRTPMNGVMGMAHLLQNTSLNDRQRGFLRTILQSADSLLAILNDILDLSKMEAGKMTLEHFPFDLRTALEDLCESMAPVAHGKGLELFCLVPSDLPDRVIGDPGRLRQILTNLISNAVKFTQHGEVGVDVQLLRSGAKHATYRFTVRDTGVGIAADRQERIFESFTQADGSTTRRFGGTGLGLTISRQLVELMGGAIGVMSQEGAGSEFWIELTLRRQDQIFETEGRRDLNGRRILIADDNNTNRIILREMLTAWNCHVDEASSGPEALARARVSDYDCAVIDMNMPQFDGLDTARSLRSEARSKDMPLILLSSSGFNPDDLHAARLFASVLFKPVRSTPLYDALVHATGGIVQSASDHEPLEIAPIDERLNGLRVLVVEDNPVNQMVATELLENWGCRWMTADNGAAAVAILSNEPFDVVLMDIQMPVMDGIEATTQIREAERGTGRHTIILAMTANAMSGDRERCLRAGMDGYLAKPLRPKELMEKLLESIGNGTTNDEGSQGDTAEEVSLFEPNRLDETCAGKDTLKVRVIERYIATSPKSVDDIESAAREGDVVQLGAAAHALKGSSLTVGSPALSQLCAKVETAARNGQIDTESAEQVGPALKRLHAVLEAYSAGLKHPSL